MSMSTNIVAFIPDNDPTYLKHKKVLLACHEAGVKELPKETAQYFGEKYVEPCYLEEKLTVKLKMEEWKNEYCSGYEIFVKDIPVGVEKIRFYNSF